MKNTIELLTALTEVMKFELDFNVSLDVVLSMK
jgi:hypothetical protein